MAVVVVTRLRLANKDVLNDFFTAAVALVEQAKGSAGILNTDVLAEANDTWWSCTSWQDRDAMQAFVNTDPHHVTMSSLDSWCDEASFVDWDQDGGELPGWRTAFDHLVAQGHSAELSNPSPDNASRSFPAPVVDPT
jgi:heme-degrading monooxygenase HmoA